MRSSYLNLSFNERLLLHANTFISVAEKINMHGKKVKLSDEDW